MEVKMMVQSTPNPNAMKFIVNMPLKTQGKASYKNAGQCAQNPLAAALFMVAHVTEVYFFDNYITITQDGLEDWAQLEDQIKKIILEKAPEHDPDFPVEEEQKAKTVVPDAPEIAKINGILDNTIRPALQMDGGDIQIVSLEGLVLTVNYFGACGSCPSAGMGTLRALESILRDQYNPDITVQAEGNMGGYEYGEPY